MSCSIVGRRFREEEHGKERTGRRKERRSVTSQVFIKIWKKKNCFC
jgi:hypothetical protein